MSLYSQKQSFAELFPQGMPFIMEGMVVNTSDPDQMGRVKVWIPSLDGESYNIDNLPWATYVSPFLGFTVEMPAGNATIKNESHAAYGFWAIPKIGSSVMVFFLNGNAAARCYFGAIPRLHRNRSFPVGRNADFNGKAGPWGDSGDGAGNLDPIQPAFDNLRTQFRGRVTESEAITRGAYERAVAQPKIDKDGTEGYSFSPIDSSYLDPQTYCLVTPGRHAIIIQDNPDFSRLRLKTAEGHQVIFDDANERIYMSTAAGNTWVEMDKDGHVHIYGSRSISMRSGKDINLFADGNINMEADKGINIRANNNDVKISAQTSVHVKANKSILMSACDVFDMSSETTLKISSIGNMDVLSDATIKQTSKAEFHLKSGGNMQVQASTMGINGGSALKQSASRIDLNGPNAGEATPAEIASCPETAASPEIVPGFEPWKRPESDSPRNPKWKP